VLEATEIGEMVRNAVDVYDRLDYAFNSAGVAPATGAQSMIGTGW